MPAIVWTYADLTPEQEQLLKEAEATLGGGMLLAFKPELYDLADLTPSQVECLEGLEGKLRLAIMAVTGATKR